MTAKRAIAGVVALAAIVTLVVVVAMSGMHHDSDDGPTARDTDGAFITGMVPHHESAVEMAEVALEQAEHAEIKQLARTIVETQNKEIDQLEAAHQRIFGEPPPTGGMHHGDLGLSDEEMGMHGDMSMLENADEFDRQFIDMMIPHHQGAIRMARVEDSKGDDAEMKDLAQKIIVAQSAEIERMNQWRQQWYGKPSPAGGVPKDGETGGSGMPHDGMGR